jgi:hypothetical protein
LGCVSHISGERATADQGVFVDGSAQRYIEELAVPEEQPVYLPGDSVSLRLRASHEVNLGSVWAVFRRLPERKRKVLADPYITLPGKHYALSRAGAVRASEVYFECEISRDQHLPGDYELEAVRAYPYELDGREDQITEFEVRGEVRFRIAEELGAPSPKVTGWKLN